MLSFAIAAVATWLAVGGALRWTPAWLPRDPPGPRKMQPVPVPLAGLPVLLALLAALLLARQPALAAITAVAGATGIVDDRAKRRGGGLAWWHKGIPLAAAAVALAAWVGAPLWQWPLIAGFAFVTINAANFLDNADGVTGSLALVGLLLADPAWTLPAAGVAAGFLPWNWPRARAYLGDGGALALGTLLAAAALQMRDRTLAQQFAPVVLLWADFVQVVTARLWLGLPPWIGDRRHLTHLLLHRGVPVRWLAPIFAFAALGLGRALQEC
jgi:UDP-N-acetylmuramyl pentapeptide phosphotransferase/UDP-N-acetylglucosamine-1-phosphate transferase